jgi:hypothetical protein
MCWFLLTHRSHLGRCSTSSQTKHATSLSQRSFIQKEQNIYSLSSITLNLFSRNKIVLNIQLMEGMWICEKINIRDANWTHFLQYLPIIVPICIFLEDRWNNYLQLNYIILDKVHHGEVHEGIVRVILRQVDLLLILSLVELELTIPRMHLDPLCINMFPPQTSKGMLGGSKRSHLGWLHGWDTTMLVYR